MEKIRELILGIGASKELANQICGELTTFVEEKDKQFEAQKTALSEEFKKRLENAKQVCIEEVDKEKKAIARKVEIFLESRQNQIARAIGKQRTLEESKAVNDLKKVKALLEGIELSGGISGEKYDAAVGQVAKLKRSLTALSEERDSAITKLNRATKIATEVLHKNKLLEGKIRQDSKPISEETSAKPTLQEEADKTKAATPKSTRRVMVENQSKGKPQQRRLGVGDATIEDIAGAVDEIA
jgi:hypothetical protein